MRKWGGSIEVGEHGDAGNGDGEAEDEAEDEAKDEDEDESAGADDGLLRRTKAFPSYPSRRHRARTTSAGFEGRMATESPGTHCPRSGVCDTSSVSSTTRRLACDPSVVRYRAWRIGTRSGRPWQRPRSDGSDASAEALGDDVGYRGVAVALVTTGEPAGDVESPKDNEGCEDEEGSDRGTGGAGTTGTKASS